MRYAHGWFTLIQSNGWYIDPELAHHYSSPQKWGWSLIVALAKNHIPEVFVYPLVN
jgi:hypothetical protein